LKRGEKRKADQQEQMTHGQILYDKEDFSYYSHEGETRKKSIPEEGRKKKGRIV